jgi:hypothetical protein
MNGAFEIIDNSRTLLFDALEICIYSKAISIPANWATKALEIG